MKRSTGNKEAATPAVAKRVRAASSKTAVSAAGKTAAARPATAAGRKAAPATRAAPAAKPARTDLLQRADWIRAGMRILAKSGVDAVLIPPLAKALGVTKGSFYWHFASRDEFLLALIEAWKQHATLRVIDIVEHAASTPQEKIRMIAFIGTNAPIDEFGGAIELAIRNWARSNQDVRRIVAGIDQERLNYLAQLYRSIGSAVDPELLACMHYSFSTGLRLIFAYPEKQKLAMRQAALEHIFLPLHGD